MENTTRSHDPDIPEGQPEPVTFTDTQTTPDTYAEDEAQRLLAEKKALEAQHQLRIEEFIRTIAAQIGVVRHYVNDGVHPNHTVQYVFEGSTATISKIDNSWSATIADNSISVAMPEGTFGAEELIYGTRAQRQVCTELSASINYAMRQLVPEVRAKQSVAPQAVQRDTRRNGDIQ